MGKKLITACLGLVALAAFALPATASASPVLTHPTGTVLGAGASLTATNVGNAILTTDPTNGEAPSVLSECTKVVITGALTKNKENHIEGNITTATFSGNGSEFNGMKECLGFGGLGNLTPTTNGTHPAGTKIDNEDVSQGTPWCVTGGGELGADKFTVRGGTCNESARPITFILDSTALGECKYERTTPIEGTFQTDSAAGKDAVFTLSGGAGTTFKKESTSSILCPGAGTLDMTFTMETDKTTAEPIYIS